MKSMPAAVRATRRSSVTTFFTSSQLMLAPASDRSNMGSSAATWMIDAFMMLPFEMVLVPGAEVVRAWAASERRGMSACRCALAAPLP